MKKIVIAAASLAMLVPVSVEARMAYLRSGDPGVPRALEPVPVSLDRQALRQEADMQVRSSISPGPALVDFSVNLPLELVPSEEDLRLFNVVDADGDGKKWGYNKNYAGFVSPNNSKQDCDDWLIFPAINFDSSKTYELSFTLAATMRGEVFSGSFEVYVGPKNSVEGMRKYGSRIDYHSTTGRTDNHEGPFVTQFGVPATGVNYVAIRCITEKNVEVDDPDSYTGKKTIHESWPIGLYDIKVQETSGSAEAVSQPDFTLTPAEKGDLKATVAFTMPLKTLNGKDLPASTQLKAVITTPAETKTVTGTPGSEQSVEVATVQGVNAISLRVDTEVEGTAQTKEVYTGVYTPNRVHDLQGVASRDNMSISMTWTPPTSAKNDGYFDPQKVTYGAYSYDSASNTFTLIEDLGQALSYTYRVPEGAPQKNTSIYIIPSNAAGMSDDTVSWIDEDPVRVTEVLGAPYKLPMREEFEGQALTYAPVLNERPGDWRGRVMISDPSGWVPDSNGSAMMAYNPSDEDPTWARASSPKISTKGVHNASVTLGVMRYAGYTSTMNLYVMNYDNASEPELLQSFDMSTGGENGWVDYAIPLPEKYQDCEWVRFYFDFNLPDVDYVGAVDYYGVAHSADNDLAVTGMSGDQGVAVGNTGSVCAEIYNVGMNETVPKARFELLSEGVVVASQDVEGEKLASGKRSTLTWEFTPTADMYGKPAAVKVTLTGDDDVADNNSRVSELTVRPAEVPVVLDLKASSAEGGVALTWSEPMRARFLTESFEHEEGWAYGEDIANFANIDLDKQTVYKFSNNAMPNEQTPKAFMVAVPSEMQTSDGLETHTGDKYLMATCPEIKADGQTPAAADDWLVSPLTVGGQFVSFWLNIINERYSETLRLMASSTGREPSDFGVQLAEIVKDKHGWQKVEAQLPVDAKYFAIHYKSRDMFGVLVDDIRYADAGDLVPLTRYEVMRDGQKIGESTSLGYLDTDVKAGERHLYQVVAVGEKTWPASNTVEAIYDPSGLEDVAADGSVVAGRGFVTVSGYAGLPVRVADTAGRLLYVGTASGTSLIVPLTPGLYMIQTGDTMHKVMVR